MVSHYYMVKPYLQEFISTGSWKCKLQFPIYFPNPNPYTKNHLEKSGILLGGAECR